MKKIVTIGLIGTLVLIGCGTVVLGEPDDPVITNRPPKAPVIIEEESDWGKECYIHTFYSIDLDGDQVYYDVSWEKIDAQTIVAASPDEPNIRWLGPFESGAAIEYAHTCHQTGTYQVTIRVKDTFDNVGQPTIIEVNHKHFSVLHSPFFSQLLEKYPVLSDLFAKIW